MSVHREQLNFCWANFYEILVWGFLLKSVNKIQVWLKLDRTTRHFMWKPVHICNPSSWLVFIILSEVPAEAGETVEHGVLFQIRIESVLCVLWTHAEETVEHRTWSIVNIGYQLLWGINWNSPHKQYLDGDQSYICCLDRIKSYSVCFKMFIAFWENILNLKSLAITEQTHQKWYTADISWIVCKSELNGDCAIELHISSSQHSEHKNCCLTFFVSKCIMVHRLGGGKQFLWITYIPWWHKLPAS